MTLNNFRQAPGWRWHSLATCNIKQIPHDLRHPTLRIQILYGGCLYSLIVKYVDIISCGQGMLNSSRFTTRYRWAAWYMAHLQGVLPGGALANSTSFQDLPHLS